MAAGSRLYIAAKAPRVGLAKTRLGEAIGHAAAVALYRAFLVDLAARFNESGLPLGWYVTPPDAWDELGPICCPNGHDVRVLDQGEGDWTERQRRLFAGMGARGESRLVLTASDSPHLPVAYVRDAFRQLETHDLVLGPVPDGGYYLIGVRAGADVLEGIAMSTATVFDQIVARADELGLSVGYVEELVDVDEAADLPRLMDALGGGEDCPATRAALESLGLALVP